MRRKRASLYSYSEDEVPPSEDPRWEGWATLISERLQEPKTTPELVAASPEFSFALLMNILAWMDLRHLVGKQREGKKIRWCASQPPKPRPLPPQCSHCGGPWNERPAGLVCAMCGRSPEETA